MNLPSDPPAPGSRPPSEDRRATEYRRPTMPFEAKRTVPSSALRWSGAGLEFALAVVLFFLGGRFLDAKVGTGPWLSVAGALLGVAVGTYLLIRAALASASRPDEVEDVARRG